LSQGQSSKVVLPHAVRPSMAALTRIARYSFWQVR
jgi:hypothetical protein